MCCAADAEAPEDEDSQTFFVESDEVRSRRLVTDPLPRALTHPRTALAPQVLGLIASFSDPTAAHAAAAERVAHVLDRYQEQPTVLDPQLEAMVVPLLEAVRKVARDGASRELLPHTCKVMYTLCKVRGYKTIVRFVPHEVADPQHHPRPSPPPLPQPLA